MQLGEVFLAGVARRFVGGKGDSRGETIPQPVAKCVFQYVRSSLNRDVSEAEQQ